MKTLVVVLALVPSLALAAEEKPAAGGDAMAGWTPPPVRNEATDRQELQELFKQMDANSRAGDLEAAAAMIDFPVTMITDDSKGQASGEAWGRERWTEAMKPFYAKPMGDARITHKPTIFLLTDSIADVTDVYTMGQGKHAMTGRTSMILVRRDGKWRVKTMAEGGWGDAMGGPAAAGGSQGPGTGTSGSTGSAGETPATNKSESDAHAPREPAPAPAPGK